MQQLSVCKGINGVVKVNNDLATMVEGMIDGVVPYLLPKSRQFLYYRCYAVSHYGC